MLPMDLSAVYPYPENGGPDLLGPSLIALVVISAAFILLLLFRPQRTVVLGMLWSLVCLAPVLQVIPAGRAFAADRFTYLPAVGLAIVMGIVLEKGLHARKGAYRTLIQRAGILIVAILGTVSYIRTDVWKDSVSLWTSVLEEYPEFAEGYQYLGSALATEKHDIPLALKAFDESIRLDDRNPNAFSNRALASYQSTHPDTSLIISDLTRAMALEPDNLENQVFLADVYHEYGLPDRAFDICSALLDAYPSLHRARLLRIRCAYELGRGDVVEEDIRVLAQAGINVSIEKGN